MTTPCELTPKQLWLPGQELHTEYPIPSNDELQDMWKNYHAEQATVASCEGVLGVYRVPDEPVRAIASIDLCEVIRDTAGALAEATGTRDIVTPGTYAGGTWYDGNRTSRDYEARVITSVLQVLMSEGHVPPLEDIPAVASLLRRWRANGVYCVANTSTLPGCEAGTITHTLGRDLPDCFDALILPRNHDGSGPLTKAKALGVLATEAGIDAPHLPIVHIDDMPHHIQGFRDHYTGRVLGLFSPIMKGLVVTDPLVQSETPLAAFERAEQHFIEQGVLPDA